MAPSSKKALISGVTGQDGALLARLLLHMGYEVIGTSRNPEFQSGNNLSRLGIYNKVKIVELHLDNLDQTQTLLKQIQPDEIYHLAGQSSVGLSFKIPTETHTSISVSTINLLEAIRLNSPHTRFYNAASSECYGDTKGQPATEETNFNPQSPYAVAKASAYWMTQLYRRSYDLFASNGVLFNHESPLRGEQFVTQKIIKTAQNIAAGKAHFLELGNLDITRDWGWANEYVTAIWKILQAKNSDDFIIATGKSHSLRDFVHSVFKYYNLDPVEHLRINQGFLRPNDLKDSSANPQKAELILGWRATRSMDDVVRGMIENDLD